MNSFEYTGNGCNKSTSSSFKSLQNYNANSMMAAPLANQTSGVYLTPVYGGLSYDALTHGQPQGYGYFDITNAYGAGADNCQQTYTQRLCGGVGVGSRPGWKCNQQSGTCAPGGNRGQQGVFGNKAQCNKGCSKQM